MTLPETVFNKILVASDLEDAVEDLLIKWFPTYLREIERQRGWEGEPLPAPASYAHRTTFDIEPGEAMPKAVVISPGLFEVPTHPQGQDGAYNAAWQMAVGIATAAKTEEEADEMVKIYGAAVRAIMVQHQSLESDAVGVFWLDESYDDLQIPDRIQLYKGAAVLFAIYVEDVVSRWAGPIVPDELAQIDSLAETVDTDIEKIPITDDI